MAVFSRFFVGRAQNRDHDVALRTPSDRYATMFGPSQLRAPSSSALHDAAPDGHVRARTPSKDTGSPVMPSQAVFGGDAVAAPALGTPRSTPSRDHGRAVRQRRRPWRYLSRRAYSMIRASGRAGSASTPQQPRRICASTSPCQSSAMHRSKRTSPSYTVLTLAPHATTKAAPATKNNTRERRGATSVGA